MYCVAALAPRTKGTEASGPAVQVYNATTGVDARRVSERPMAGECVRAGGRSATHACDLFSPAQRRGRGRTGLAVPGAGTVAPCSCPCPPPSPVPSQLDFFSCWQFGWACGDGRRPGLVIGVQWLWPLVFGSFLAGSNSYRVHMLREPDAWPDSVRG